MPTTDNALHLQAHCKGTMSEPRFVWSNGFAQLPPAFYTHLHPTPLPEPRLRAWSPQVAANLGWEASWLGSDEAAQVLGGSALLEGMDPIATVYSGHQFGQWAGQLGDGRAILLGEKRDQESGSTVGYEIQLKGSGMTPYSRMGDGRAVLRSSIREYLCSEAMYALGIPTTRALSLVTSTQSVYRETVETAAVVARVAPSFVRFGHFEHFAARNQIDALRTLADYVIQRYYPELHSLRAPACYAALLREVSLRTADLLAQWQAIGFCHGVMNTDNMSILGLTLDYGPFQFLDQFDANHICNHSDNSGRYAFARQPQMAYWNLFCLGQALLPLIEDEKATVAAIDVYKDRLQQSFAARMTAKLGLTRDSAGAETLIPPLLSLLQQHAVDYTIFWRELSHAVANGHYAPVAAMFGDSSGWQDWLRQYQERMARLDTTQTSASMLQTNPKYILRNYLGQAVIEAAQRDDWQPLRDLQAVLQSPYEEHPAFEDWAKPPPDWARHIAISCSS